MKLFKKEFLDNLEKKFSHPSAYDLINSLIKVDGLNFYESILLMAKWKRIKIKETDYAEK